MAPLLLFDELNTGLDYCHLTLLLPVWTDTEEIGRVDPPAMIPATPSIE